MDLLYKHAYKDVVKIIIDAVSVNSFIYDSSLA